MRLPAWRYPERTWPSCIIASLASSLRCKTTVVDASVVIHRPTHQGTMSPTTRSLIQRGSVRISPLRNNKAPHTVVEETCGCLRCAQPFGVRHAEISFNHFKHSRTHQSLSPKGRLASCSPHPFVFSILLFSRCYAILAAPFCRPWFFCCIRSLYSLLLRLLSETLVSPRNQVFL